MKLIHISDLHYGQPGATGKNARVLNALCARPDIGDCTVIITGDVVDTPDDRIYRTATSALTELAGACGRLILAPGNHDLNTQGVTPHPTSHIRWAGLVEGLTGQRPAYPALHANRSMSIISVDTNRTPPGAQGLTQAFTATGYVGSDQISEVALMVRWARKRDLPVIVAFHHCPSGGDPLLQLHDRHELGAALEAAGGVDLILTGHLHQTREWSEVFGAKYLLSSPKTPDVMGYRLISWERDVESFRWEWIRVAK